MYSIEVMSGLKSCGYPCSCVERLPLSPGDPKYHKTTVAGLTGRYLDAALLVVAATTGMSTTCAELFSVAHALGIRVCVVVSKVDVCGPEVVLRTIEQIERTCVDLGFQGVEEIQTTTAAASALTGGGTHSGRFLRVPLIRTSSVSGEHIDLVRVVLHSLFSDEDDTDNHRVADRGGLARPPMRTTPENLPATLGPVSRDPVVSVEMQVQEVFDVCSTGPIVGGILRQGRIALGDTVYVGPVNTRGADSRETSLSPDTDAGPGTGQCVSLDTPHTDTQGLGQDDRCDGDATRQEDSCDGGDVVSAAQCEVPSIPSPVEPPLFVPAIVASLRRNRTPCEIASAGSLWALHACGLQPLLRFCEMGYAVRSVFFLLSLVDFFDTIVLLSDGI